FEHWSPPVDGAALQNAPIVGIATDKIVGAVNYVQAIRFYGHVAARLDPLGSEPLGDPALQPEAHGITEEDVRQLPASLVGGPIGETAPDALEATRALKEVYCSSIGYDYDHIRDPEERLWLREAAESRRLRPPQDPIDVKALLARLTQVEAFERFLHRIFPG